MELLQELFDSDLGLGISTPVKPPAMQMAAFLVLMDDTGRVALLRSERDGMHRLPGGVIPTREASLSALQPLVQRDVGVQADVRGEVGMVIEYRYHFPLVQISWCWYGFVESESGAGTVPMPADDRAGQNSQQQSLDSDRTASTPVWLPIVDAMNLLSREVPTTYAGRFTRARDLLFLGTALERFHRKGITQCASLSEVTGHFDRIDRMLMRLLAERGAFIRQAAAFMDDPDAYGSTSQLRNDINRIRQLARTEGVDPGLADTIYREVLRAFLRSD